jgi:Protein of unknown function (DUF3631).
MAGGGWPERTLGSLIKLCVQTSADDSLGVKLLADVRLVFDEVKIDRLSTQDLLRGLVDLDTDSPWATWWEDNLKHENTRGPARRLAHLLKPYRIEPRTIRLPDNTTAKGYCSADFLDAWKRYLPLGSPKVT